ncbi:MAG: FHA domain-containing protein [Armatimonadetes bacterium]|nr:FHA domain-containing protein [Armatimonadota bacterium]
MPKPRSQSHNNACNLKSKLRDMMRLVVENGPHAGKQLDIQVGRSTIGRAPDSTLCLANDPSVSRSHLEVPNSGQEVTIRDLGSTSGTFVNGVAAPSQQTIHAKHGDRLRLGQSIVRIDSVASNSHAAPPPVVRKTDGKSCFQCGSSFSMFGARAKSHEFPALCNQCAGQTLVKLERFRRSLQGEINMWNGAPSHLRDRVTVRASEAGLDVSLALSRSADIAGSFLQRVLAFLLQDGQLDEAEEKIFFEYMSALNVSEQHIPSLVGQVRHYAFLRELRAGTLPTIRPSAMLPSAEIAHIEVPAVYFRELSSSYRRHTGSFLVTNSRFIFTQTDAPFEVALSKVLGITLCPPNQFELQLARRQGTGVYQCDQAFYVVEVARAALEFHLRHRVLQQSSSRAIPPDIKAAVWARDGGRCVECAEGDYLEFDHVIPFSKGGATSTNNLQLLCRRCNLKKSDRI